MLKWTTKLAFRVWHKWFERLDLRTMWTGVRFYDWLEIIPFFLFAIFLVLPLRIIYRIMRYPDDELPTYPTPLVESAMEVWRAAKNK